MTLSRHCQSSRTFCQSVYDLSPERLLLYLFEDEGAEVDEAGGVAGALLECFRCCDSDVRRSVAGNIVFCGGGSMIPGMNTSSQDQNTIYENIRLTAISIV